jgi:hypothetical protein
MLLATPTATFHYPADFDERAEFEMTSKGYLSGGSVELQDGRRYPVTFYDPMRLAQDVEASGSYGIPMLAEPGLVVIPEVTREAIERTIPELIELRFFDHLKPINVALANGTVH